MEEEQGKYQLPKMVVIQNQGSQKKTGAFAPVNKLCNGEG
jgi:hypothetical protein